MGGETVTEMWFINIWKNSRKSISWEPERPVIGILSFEISRLMLKVVNLWQCLADGQIARLREEIVNSVGIQKLVSEDGYYLMDLALAEIIENLRSVAKSVAVLGKKCVDPKYHKLEKVFDDLGEIDPQWYGWQYRLKKIERKVKKMERFVAATEQLYQELDVLAELEQTLRLMRAGADVGAVKLLEFQQKTAWQRQEVKNLREMSPWVRTYDYIVRLLLRSLFTIVERIKYVYGCNHRGHVEGSNIDEHVGTDCLIHSNSIHSLMQSSVYPSENNSSNFPVLCSSISSARVSFFNSKRQLLKVPPSSLGYAALSLHYANIIILIEKLASLPHLISLDARDDLYKMLPATIRSCLRAKLKSFSRTSAFFFYDDAFAAEWNLALSRILEWLCPLARNMIRWQAERNIERRRLVLGSNVLLVQTLYFADQVKTEAAIVELLMGLNYLSRFCREINQRPFQMPSCSSAFDGYIFPRDNI